ncbi:multifunctional CCA addition/repair protein [Catenovulum sediminis]|uniref:Multifunctional CCA protein n=1 Tax=Catenovulum sediminis TaxID=1740262 RepID=A0ABV1RJ63_9ALTE|nr:multifunctional CCA addition/repair protein [Catenovulum sediminis]
MKVFLVGGAVRDALLNIPVKDRDWVVVGSSESKMKSLGYQQVGKDFPVFLHPKTQEEYALARTERKVSAGYTGFVCDSSSDVTLEDDLKRRDLTINAIAQDAEGQLIDPFNGLQDIKSKTIRHVSDAFIEDPLRVLRAARFAARFAHLGFTIAPETMTLMETMVKQGELSNLQAERIWLEIEKSLACKSPWIFFQTLRECGALKVILPELDVLWGVPNPAKWHPEIDTGIHTMMVLEQASIQTDDIRIRFAALVHDLGKGLTPKDKWPSHHGHEKSGVQVIKKLVQRLVIPNKFKDLAMLVSEFHCHVHKAFELKASTILKVFDSCDLWRKPERFTEILNVSEADFRGRTGFEKRPYPQSQYLQQIADAVLKIKAKPFLEQGYTGLALKEQMNIAKLQTIEKIKQAHQ